MMYITLAEYYMSSMSALPQKFKATTQACYLMAAQLSSFKLYHYLLEENRQHQMIHPSESITGYSIDP